MAIVFPHTLPIVYYKWVDRNTKAAIQMRQLVHIRDEGMFQLNDETYNQHRVLVMDKDFAILNEITGDDLDLRVVGSKNVLTYSVDYSEYVAQGDTCYLAVVDANVNKFMQNFMPGGDFSSATNWELSNSKTVINTVSQVMTFTATSGGDTSEATYTLPLKVGSEYTITVTAGVTTGTVSSQLLNGATVIGSIVTGANSFTFTATDQEISIAFGSLTAGTFPISEVTCKMSYEDVTPEWVSSPFCVDDIEATTQLLYGCANNDYFGLYMADTGLTPQLRIRSEIIPTDSVQETEQIVLSNGSLSNYYASNVAAFRLNIDWAPAYCVHFVKVVFLMDEPHVDDDAYRMIQPVEVVEDRGATEIKAYSVLLTTKNTGVTFKRIVNDPADASCIIDSGAYRNGYFDEDYVQQGTQTTYYPQT